MLPIGDDEGAAHGARIVTIALIALNVLAFLVELGQGSEAALQSFITAWGVVPREYGVGHDLPPTIPLPLLVDADHVDVPARRLDAPGRQHALPLDLRRQPRARRWARRASSLLPRLRHRGGPRAHPVRRRLRRAERRRVGRDQRRARRLPAALPAEPRPGADPRRRRVGAGDRGARHLDRDPAGQRHRLDRANTSEGGGVAYMAHIGGFVAGMALVKLFATGSSRPRDERRRRE